MRPTGKEAIKFLEEWDSNKNDIQAKAAMASCYGARDRQMRGWAESIRKEILLDKAMAESGTIDKGSFAKYVEPEIKYIPYPDLGIKPFKMLKTRDEEDIVVVLADHHAGKVTPNYNEKIYNARMNKLIDDTMLIINLHRPIRKAHIFALGDMVQGENTRQGSKAGEIDRNVRGQIREVAVPVMARYVASIAQGVSEVNFYGVRGNHGRYSNEALDGTNWDLVFYDYLKMSLQNQKNISVEYSEEFSLLINIKGFRFFIFHGDQCKGNAAVPVIAMRRKTNEWYANVGGFNYGYAGHFHSEYQDKVNSMADYTIAPPLVTGDAWAVEKIGRISYPQQLCFGVHEKYGRTWRYSLFTDEGYLPKKYNEPEGVVNEI